MKKNKSVAILAVVLAVVVALGYYTSLILSSTGKGAGQNITLSGNGRGCHIRGDE
jgi:hypothetical protein